PTLRQSRSCCAWHPNEKKTSRKSETGSQKPQAQSGDNALRRDVRLAGAVEEGARSKRRHPCPSGCRRRCVASAPQLGRSRQPKTSPRFRKARCKGNGSHVPVMQGHAPRIPEISGESHFRETSRHALRCQRGTELLSLRAIGAD